MDLQVLNEFEDLCFASWSGNHFSYWPRLYELKGLHHRSRETYISVFQEICTSTDKIFISGGGLRTRQ